MLSNFELEQMGKDYKIDLIVCPKDKLPITPTYSNFIVNLDNSNEEGSHWVCLIANKNLSYYFDSYGELPPVEIINYVKNIKSKHLYYNAQEIQSLKSEFCGYFCFSLLLYMKHNKFNLKNINQFINIFDDTDPRRNDDILKSIYIIYNKNYKNNKLTNRLMNLKF